MKQLIFAFAAFTLVSPLFSQTAQSRMDSSTFTFLVQEPVARMKSVSFANNSEYPINNVFQFTAGKCGVCIPENIQNIDPKSIKISVETEDGQNLLDEVSATEQFNHQTGGAIGTLVKFHLKGTIRKDGEIAVIRIGFGELYKTYSIRIFPKE